MLTSTVVLDDFDLSLRTSGLINLIFAKALALDQVLVSQLRSWLRQAETKIWSRPPDEDMVAQRTRTEYVNEIFVGIKAHGQKLSQSKRVACGTRG